MSVTLAIYDPTTGEILRRVSCSENVAAAQVRDGEAVLEIARGLIFSDATHRVDTTTQQLVTKE